MKTSKWSSILFSTMILTLVLSANHASAETAKRDHRKCAVAMPSGVKYTGNLSSLTAACRAQALRINAQVAEAEDKSNDDDDDDDDTKVQITAKNVETQKSAADASFKAARQDLLEARAELAKATTPDARKAAEQEVKEAEDDYNKQLDAAAGVAKKISDKAQRSIRASLAKQQAAVKKLEDKLKTATGKAKLEIEADVLEDHEDIAEKEKLLAKSNLVESLQQARFVAKKLNQAKALRDAAVQRVERARESFERTEDKVKATIAKARERATEVTAELKKLGAQLKKGVKSVKAKAETFKKKFKDLEKDVKGATDKVKNISNQVSDAIDDLFDF
jgi:hypothetical protein